MDTFTKENIKKIEELANELSQKTYAFMLENMPEQNEFSDISIMVCAAMGIIFTLGAAAHQNDEMQQENLILFVSQSLRRNFDKFNQN